MNNDLPSSSYVSLSLPLSLKPRDTHILIALPSKCVEGERKGWGCSSEKKKRWWW